MYRKNFSRYIGLDEICKDNRIKIILNNRITAFTTFVEDITHYGDSDNPLDIYLHISEECLEHPEIYSKEYILKIREIEALKDNRVLIPNELTAFDRWAFTPHRKLNFKERVEVLFRGKF